MRKMAFGYFILLLIGFVPAAWAQEVTQQESPCTDDMFSKNHVPLQARYLKFFDWMFTNHAPYNVVYKNPSTYSLAGDNKSAGYFLAHVYAPEAFADIVDLGVYGSFPPPSSQQLRFITVSYDNKVPPSEALTQFPPEKIRDRTHYPISKRNIFIFVEDEKNTINHAQINAAVARLKEATTPSQIFETFTPESHCEIYRQRENYRIIATYGRITVGASPEIAARCAATTAMANFGFSNIPAIFSDETLVVQRQQSKAKDEGSYKGTNRFGLDKNDNRYRLNIMPPPYAMLYDSLYRDGASAEAIRPGQTMCQVSDDLYLVEVSQCTAIKRQNVDGSFERKFFANYVTERFNRCKQFGINIKN